jgi:hypothetical protein
MGYLFSSHRRELNRPTSLRLRLIPERGLVKLLAVLVMALFIGCKGCRSTAAALQNGDLSHGSASPDYWQADPTPPGTTVLRWNHPTGGPDELEIYNIKPNDSHWTQTVHLEQGWYLFTASVRTEGIPAGNAGANLSSLVDGIISSPLSGTTGWKTIGFYLKIGKAGFDVPIACRLGGYSSPNTGKAWFRNITGTRVDAPTQPDMPRYDLDTILGIGVATPQPTRAPYSEPTVAQKILPVPAEVPDKNAPQPSKRDLVIEHSIDRIEKSMAIVIIMATLYAGGIAVRGKLRPRDDQEDHGGSSDPPSPGVSP